MSIKIIENAIVGGGPAGSYLAYLLGKENREVVIFDHSHPREKSCGGGVGPLGFKKFSFLKDLKSARIVNGFKLISPTGREVIIEGEPGIIFSRKESDWYLLEKAIDNGSTHIPEKVTEISKKNNIWELKTNKRKIFKAKNLIGADGALSTVRKHVLKEIDKTNLSVTINYYMKNVEDNNFTIKFLKDVRGYIWIFPRKDHASVGIGIDFNNAKKAKSELDSFVKNYCKEGVIVESRGALIPIIKDISFYDLPAAGDNWALVGDAAGHVDPITGEGIIFALWGAELLSKAILNGDIKSYDSLWRKVYGHNLMTGTKFLHTFYKPNILELIIMIARNSKTFAKIVHKTIGSEIFYENLIMEIVKNSPKILIESVNNKLFK